MRGLADEGRTVIFSSHALSEVELIADHVLVMAQGRPLRSSSLAALRAEAGVGSRVLTPDRDRIVLHGLEGTADLEKAFFRLTQEPHPMERSQSAEGVRS